MSKRLRDVRWPFFVLLVVLAALALIAPRRWRFDSEMELAARRKADRSTPRQQRSTPAFDTLAVDWWSRQANAARAASVVAATPGETSPPHQADVSAHVPELVTAHVTEQVDAPETSPRPAVTGLPVGENAVATNVAANGATHIAAESTAPPIDESHSAGPDPAVITAPEPSSATTRPKREPTDIAAGSPREYDVPHPLPPDVANEQTLAAGAWPMPARTIERLGELARHDATRAWAGEMLCVFDDLRRASAMSPQEFAATLGYLERLLAAAEKLESQLPADPALVAQIARTRLAVERRFDAWRSVYTLHQAAGGDRLASRDRAPAGTARDPASVLRVAPSPEALLADAAVALLDDIEAYEASPTTHTARKIALAARRLSSDPNQTARQLGQHVGLNYRNANVRVAAHGELLNRFLPQPAETAADVADFVAGVPVHGTQRTRTRLLLRLVPDDRRIRLGLEAHGEVDSDTAATSGPATVYTTGETRFLARKLLLLDGRRWHLFPATAAAENESSLAGMRTDFDPFPIVNSLVRSVVRSQHDQRRWSAEREVEDRVSQHAQAQLDAEADPRFSDLTTKATASIVRPLERLGLEPTPIALATTEERVIFRYRLASGQQLGGHTPRPRAPGDSLLSVQLHESAINNALANLDLAGRTFELRSLYESVAARLGRPDIKVPDDVPEGVEVTFAAENPLEVRLVDNAAHVTLRIDRLDAERETWRDLTVIAVYEPQVDGLDAIFSRNGPIRLSGKSLSTRSNIVLRGVFSKMFTRNKQVHLLPPAALADARLADLAVSQLVVHDGWVGLAIGPRRAAGELPTDATVDAETATRDGAAQRGARQ